MIASVAGECTCNLGDVLHVTQPFLRYTLPQCNKESLKSNGGIKTIDLLEVRPKHRRPVISKLCTRPCYDRCLALCKG